ncbi:O-antigen ligase family protein [Photobacterium sanguinicancri]|uniref:O-antigen ligase family protein n=1 Tax=Photobacterium sanguinicancri TaxID=875932 RepID=UPI0021C4BF91|nr:O-antigen ligase family protein [Photobacterium sanguinicancri]
MNKCVEWLFIAAVLLSSFGSALSYHPPLGVGKDIINFILFLLSLVYLFFNKHSYNRATLNFFFVFVLYFSLHLVSYTTIDNVIDGLRFQLIYLLTFIFLALSANLSYDRMFLLIVKTLFYSGCVVVFIGVFEYFEPSIIEKIYGVPQSEIPNIRLPVGYRLISTMLNPINLGVYVCFVVSSGYLLYRKRLVNSGIFFMTCFLSLAVNFFTLSRLAFLAFVVMLLVIIFLELKRSVRFFVLMLPIICITLFYSAGYLYDNLDNIRVIERMTSSFDSNTLSNNSRLDNWMFSLSYLDTAFKFFWGLGLGVVRAGGDENTLLAENMFVGLLLEFGFIGVCLFVSFFVLLFVNNKSLKKIDVDLYYFNILFFGCFFIMSLGNDMYTNYPFVLYFWLFSCYLISFGCNKRL